MRKLRTTSTHTLSAPPGVSTLPLALIALCVSTACGGPDDAAVEPGARASREEALTANARAGTSATTTSSVTLRQGPGTRYASLATLPAGTSVTLAAAGAPTDSFYKVTAGGKTGWVYGRALRSKTAVYGYYPDARDALVQLGIGSSRVSQTIGGAPASAGYHLRDGSANGTDYCAATDVRVIGLSETQIKSLLESMGRLGFAGWYRKPGYDGWPSTEAPHIHTVFAGAAMKYQLAGQVDDWLAGRNGLTSHTTYRFFQWSPAAVTAVKRLQGLVAAPEGRDGDGDGRLDFVDNCPTVANANQANSDGDGQGDACDTDLDDDGVRNTADNCPATKNASQADLDHDGLGDACDPDDDGDGAKDGVDNCPRTPNPNQRDADGDGTGDACQVDDDADGHADGADNCPLTSNADQANADGDAQGDACDSDADDDGVPNATDVCPLVKDTAQADLDGDGVGDACDADRDGDSVDDADDNCPDLGNAAQDDDDANGVGDACELFVLPKDQQEAPPDPAPVAHGDGEVTHVAASCSSAPAPATLAVLMALLALRRRRGALGAGRARQRRRPASS